MDIRDYYKIIKKRKAFILIVFTIVLLTYILFIYLKPPIYKASSSIMLQEPPFEAQLLDLPLRSILQPTAVVNMPTQLTLMKSRLLAEKVIEDIKKNTNLILELNEVLRAVDIYQSPEAGHVINIDVTFHSKKKAILIANTYARISKEENIKAQKGQLTATKEYLERQIEKYTQRLRNYEENLRKFNQQYNVIDFNQALQNSIDRVNEYHKEIEKLKIEEENVDILIDHLKIKLQEQPEFKQTITFLPNREIEKLKDKLIEYEIQLFEATQNYTDKHPKVKTLKTRINRIKQLIYQKFKSGIMPSHQKKEEEEEKEKELIKSAPPKFKKSELEFVGTPTIIANPLYEYFATSLSEKQMNKLTIAVKIVVLQRMAAIEEEKLKNLSAEQLNYTRLLRKVKVTEDILSTLSNNYEQMQMIEAGKIGIIRIVELAKEAVAIRKIDLMNFLFMIIATIIISIATGVAIEFLDTKVTTPYKVKRYLNLPVIGTIPKLKTSYSPLLTKLELHAPLNEVYNKVCLQLEHQLLKKQAKTVVVTSAKPQEGKSTIACNIGVALARRGRKVILVDSDIRRPFLHKIFNIATPIGLSDVLMGELEAKEKLLSTIIDEVLIKTEVVGLYLLPAGRQVFNPVHLLSQDKLKEVIDILKNKADIIIFDASPCIVVADSLIISKKADCILLVFNAEEIQRKDALAAKRILTDIDIDIVGVILNNCKIEETEEYYYSYYRKYHERK